MNTPFEIRHTTMGSPWEIDIWDQSVSEDIDSQIISLLDNFNATFSRFRDDSLVARLNSQGGRHTVPYECIDMLKMYLKLYHVTDGLMNPLVGQTLSDVGYDAAYSLTPKKTIADTPAFNEVIHILDDETLEISQPVLVDFGALGKGYAVDLVCKLLEKEQLQSYVVNGSGDMRHQGEHPLKVGLEHPGDSTKVIGSIDLQNGSIASSGSNRRTWGQYHHILNPHTQSSPDFIKASWVQAADAATADLLATALFLVPPEQLSESYEFEYLLINSDLRLKKSSGWSGEIYV